MSPHELLSLKCQYEELGFLPLSGSNMTSLLSSLVLDGLKKKLEAFCCIIRYILDSHLTLSMEVQRRRSVTVI